MTSRSPTSMKELLIKMRHGLLSLTIVLTKSLAYNEPLLLETMLCKIMGYMKTIYMTLETMNNQGVFESRDVALINSYSSMLNMLSTMLRVTPSSVNQSTLGDQLINLLKELITVLGTTTLNPNLIKSEIVVPCQTMFRDIRTALDAVKESSLRLINSNIHMYNVIPEWATCTNFKSTSITLNISDTMSRGTIGVNFGKVHTLGGSTTLTSIHTITTIANSWGLKLDAPALTLAGEMHGSFNTLMTSGAQAMVDYETTINSMTIASNGNNRTINWPGELGAVLQHQLALTNINPSLRPWGDLFHPSSTLTTSGFSLLEDIGPMAQAAADTFSVSQLMEGLNEKFRDHILIPKLHVSDITKYLKIAIDENVNYAHKNMELEIINGCMKQLIHRLIGAIDVWMVHYVKIEGGLVYLMALNEEMAKIADRKFQKADSVNSYIGQINPNLALSDGSVLDGGYVATATANAENSRLKIDLASIRQKVADLEETARTRERERLVAIGEDNATTARLKTAYDKESDAKDISSETQRAADKILLDLHKEHSSQWEAHVAKLMADHAASIKAASVLQAQTQSKLDSAGVEILDLKAKNSVGNHILNDLQAKVDTLEGSTGTLSKKYESAFEDTKNQDYAYEILKLKYEEEVVKYDQMEGRREKWRILSETNRAKNQALEIKIVTAEASRDILKAAHEANQQQLTKEAAARTRIEGLYNTLHSDRDVFYSRAVTAESALGGSQSEVAKQLIEINRLTAELANEKKSGAAAIATRDADIARLRIERNTASASLAEYKGRVDTNIRVADINKTTIESLRREKSSYDKNLSAMKDVERANHLNAHRVPTLEKDIVSLKAELLTAQRKLAAAEGSLAGKVAQEENLKANLGTLKKQKEDAEVRYKGNDKLYQDLILSRGVLQTKYDDLLRATTKTEDDLKIERTNFRKSESGRRDIMEKVAGLQIELTAMRARLVDRKDEISTCRSQYSILHNAHAQLLRDMTALQTTMYGYVGQISVGKINLEQRDSALQTVKELRGQYAKLSKDNETLVAKLTTFAESATTNVPTIIQAAPAPEIKIVEKIVDVTSKATQNLIDKLKDELVTLKMNVKYHSSEERKIRDLLKTKESYLKLAESKQRMLTGVVHRLTMDASIVYQKELTRSTLDQRIRKLQEDALMRDRLVRTQEETIVTLSKNNDADGQVGAIQKMYNEQYESLTLMHEEREAQYATIATKLQQALIKSGVIMGGVDSNLRPYTLTTIIQEVVDYITTRSRALWGALGIAPADIPLVGDPLEIIRELKESSLSSATPHMYHSVAHSELAKMRQYNSITRGVMSFGDIYREIISKMNHRVMEGGMDGIDYSVDDGPVVIFLHRVQNPPYSLGYYVPQEKSVVIPQDEHLPEISEIGIKVLRCVNSRTSLMALAAFAEDPRVDLQSVIEEDSTFFKNYSANMDPPKIIDLGDDGDDDDDDDDDDTSRPPTKMRTRGTRFIKSSTEGMIIDETERERGTKRKISSRGSVSRPLIPVASFSSDPNDPSISRGDMLEPTLEPTLKRRSQEPTPQEILPENVPREDFPLPTAPLPDKDPWVVVSPPAPESDDDDEDDDEDDTNGGAILKEQTRSPSPPPPPSSATTTSTVLPPAQPPPERPPPQSSPPQTEQPKSQGLGKKIQFKPSLIKLPTNLHSKVLAKLNHQEIPPEITIPKEPAEDPIEMLTSVSVPNSPTPTVAPEPIVITPLSDSLSGEPTKEKIPGKSQRVHSRAAPYKKYPEPSAKPSTKVRKELAEINKLVPGNINIEDDSGSAIARQLHLEFPGDHAGAAAMDKIHLDHMYTQQLFGLKTVTEPVYDLDAPISPVSDTPIVTVPYQELVVDIAPQPDPSWAFYNPDVPEVIDVEEEVVIAPEVIEIVDVVDSASTSVPIPVAPLQPVEITSEDLPMWSTPEDDDVNHQDNCEDYMDVN
nr:hypothetical protein [Salmonid herpesvirus 1]